jgi:hypothetical protein
MVLSPSELFWFSLPAERRKSRLRVHPGKCTVILVARFERLTHCDEYRTLLLSITCCTLKRPLTAGKITERTSFDSHIQHICLFDKDTLLTTPTTAKQDLDSQKATGF